ncbi:MAG: hypothetical protein KDD45_03025 [Bdellovibrionales bacterium]|nr:hypothetical protein [Bdellovibrionales bacterium]
MIKSLFLFLFSFAVGLSSYNLENGFQRSPNDPKTVSISIINKEEANKLFKELSAHKEIPFRYPIDGCYARAHAMAQIAEKENITTGKVFIVGYLRVKTDSTNYPLVEWGWHVAPIVVVEDGKQDQVGPQREHNVQYKNYKIMVLDPSLANKPLSIAEWKNIMKYDGDGGRPEVKKIYFGARYQYYPSDSNKKGWQISDLENMEKTFENYRPFEEVVSQKEIRKVIQPNGVSK